MGITSGQRGMEIAAMGMAGGQRGMEMAAMGMAGGVSRYPKPGTPGGVPLSGGKSIKI